VSGEARRSNQKADAQQYPPVGAKPAPGTGSKATGSGAAEGRGNESLPQGTGENVAAPEVRWVGEQRLMQGYCGRATFTGQPGAPEGDGPGPSGAPAPRTVVLLQRQGRPVVRIGPRPAQDNGSTARAA
jgi:hypothetical protein